MGVNFHCGAKPHLQFQLEHFIVSEGKGGSWVFRDIPRHTMQRMKIAAAIEGKSLKQLLLDLCETYLKDLERKGLMPKGKG